MNETTLLSVCLITYNHVNYIREAIDGVLMQRVNFTWELIIADDYSTDGTREIVIDYSEKYPDFIKLILQKENVGAAKNWIDLLNEPQSKYIAYFEGDDYWTDPYKLQKQIDFLEENDDFSICFHPVKILKDGELVGDFITRNVNDITTIDDLIIGNYIHTPSVVFRNNDHILNLVGKLNNNVLGDYFLYIINSQYGLIKKLPDVMAVYRFGVGSWTGNTNEKNKSTMYYNTINYASKALNSNYKLIDLWYKSLIVQNKIINELDLKDLSEFEHLLLTLYSPKMIMNNVKFKTLLKIIFVKLLLKLKRKNN